MTSERHPVIAGRDQSVLVLVDCQERLMGVIDRSEEIAARAQLLLRAANLLAIPILLTEQYRKGLGPTVAPLLAAAGDVKVIEKMSFSCFGETAFVDAVRALQREHLFIAGIETHVCVGQTALDGIALGYRVHLVEDAAGSRTERDRALGVARMASNGVTRTSVEATLFDWLERCDDPAFKSVQALLK